MYYFICWTGTLLTITILVVTATRKDLRGKVWLISSLGALFISHLYTWWGWLLGSGTYNTFSVFIDPYLYYTGYVLLLKYVVVATPRKMPESKDSMNWLDRQFANTKPWGLLLACIIGWWFMIPFSLIGMIFCSHPKAIKRASLIFIVQISLILVAVFIGYLRYGLF